MLYHEYYVSYVQEQNENQEQKKGEGIRIIYYTYTKQTNLIGNWRKKGFLPKREKMGKQIIFLFESK